MMLWETLNEPDSILPERGTAWILREKQRPTRIPRVM